MDSPIRWRIPPSSAAPGEVGHVAPLKAQPAYDGWWLAVYLGGGRWKAITEIEYAPLDGMGCEFQDGEWRWVGR